VALICACLALPLACAAQEHSAAAGHGEGDGAPKPALLTFDPGAAIWSIIVFVVLLLVLRGVAWRPILRVLNDREQFIRKSIDDAKQEREQASKLLKDYEVQLAKAREQASAIVAEGRRDAEVVKNRLKEEARKEGEDLITRAKREIQLATDTARKELHDEVSELAVRVAAGILRKQLTPADHTDLVAQSLKEMQAAGKVKMN
jgi:F-type H+-transporting ATPase subunit b